MKAVIALIVVASEALGWVQCSPSVIESDRLAHAVVDLIRWKRYWFATTHVAPVGQAAATLMFGGGHAGYCIAAWDSCAIFRFDETEILHQVNGAKFDARRESGVWVMARPMPHERSLQPDGSAAHELSAGGKKIGDPLSGSKTTAQPQALEQLQFKTCLLDSSLLGPEPPDAIRTHIRPAGASSLLRAIREQGLIKTSTRIVVPYFSDRDPEVFIRLETASGQVDILLALRWDKEWWRFRPGSEIGTPVVLRHIGDQIERGAMVTITQNSTATWTTR